MNDYQAPMVWFGGKSRVAPMVWQACFSILRIPLRRVET